MAVKLRDACIACVEVEMFLYIVELVFLGWLDEWGEPEAGEFRKTLTGKMLSAHSLFFLLGEL